MAEADKDHRQGYDNPNFDRLKLRQLERSEHSEEEEEITEETEKHETYYYTSNTTTTPDNNNSVKNGSIGRRRYKDFSAAEMGVPTKSPVESPIKSDSRANSLYYERETERNYEYVDSSETRQQTTAKFDFYTDDRVDQQQRRVDMSIDYSPTDFQRSLATIGQAAKDGDGGFYPGGGVRVRKDGDTTVVTEHRDPYSFYWQLEQAKREQEDSPRRLPPPDYDQELLNPETILSPDSHDSGIQLDQQKEAEYSRPEPAHKQLPPGWEKHEDPSGFSYYWHVDSGTIQREVPTMTRQTQASIKPEIIDRIIEQPPQIIQLPPQQPIIQERAFKQTTTKRRVDNERDYDGSGDEGLELMESDATQKPIRFAVRSLGWTEISEEDLTVEKSSRAVNRAIVDLSTGRNDIIDNVAKWGDGRELIMELDDHDLRLIDPDSFAVMHNQSIHQIRVWGVGRDNGRDFAYVARDRSSRRFMCHVFRCDTPARTIANTLRDICRRLMLEKRPNTLQTTNNRRRVVRESSFPTPMEEPKKIIRCHFLGVTQVPRSTGIDILNEAVDRLVSQVRQERWILVDASIAPSTIAIQEVGGNQIAECRVRYLSFLGIGRDVKHCAFIMHTSSENFMCYVFHVEPSAGAMAKTIEAACKLRYQKVLDAHAANGRKSSLSNSRKPWGDSIRGAFGSVRQRFYQ